MGCSAQALTRIVTLSRAAADCSARLAAATSMWLGSCNPCMLPFPAATVKLLAGPNCEDVTAGRQLSACGCDAEVASYVV